MKINLAAIRNYINKGKMDLPVLRRERYQKSSWKILNYGNTRLHLPTKPDPDLFK